MAFETIIIEKKDKIGMITLNRPQKFNTFNAQMAEELNAALRQLDEDNKIRVVIVKGAGKVFSTGIDVVNYRGKLHTSTIGGLPPWIRCISPLLPWENR